jgi:hypothetical protein
MTQDAYKKSLDDGIGELNFDKMTIYTKYSFELTLKELMVYKKSNFCDDFFKEYLENNCGYSEDAIALIERFGDFEDLLSHPTSLTDIDFIVKEYHLIAIDREEYKKNEEKIVFYGRIMRSYHAQSLANNKFYFLEDEYYRLIKNSI